MIRHFFRTINTFPGLYSDLLNSQLSSQWEPHCSS